jgi:hypothetical protein
MDDGILKTLLSVLSLIIVFEIVIYILYGRIINKYFIDVITGRNWLILVNIMLFVFVIAYLAEGGIDTKNWIDTMGYYSQAVSIANGTLNIGDYIASQEWPPHVGYDIFLGLLFWIVGNNVTVACMMNIFFAVLSSYVLFKIGLYLADPVNSLKTATQYMAFPLLIHFSIFLLKEMSVLLLVELTVLTFFMARNNINIIRILMVGVPLSILFFYRSFYVLFLILWMAICIFNNKKQTTIEKAVFSLLIVLIFILIISIAGALDLNIGYTLGGKESFLDFLPETRVSLNWTSISMFVSLIASHFSQFLTCAVKELLRIFVGPFYWLHRGNFFYLQETGRFVLFENLSSIYLIAMLPRAFRGLDEIRKDYNRKCLLWLLIIFTISLLLVGDVRWRLSLIPIYFLLTTKVDHEMN